MLILHCVSTASIQKVGHILKTEQKENRIWVFHFDPSCGSNVGISSTSHKIYASTICNKDRYLTCEET